VGEGLVSRSDRAAATGVDAGPRLLSGRQCAAVPSAAFWGIASDMRGRGRSPYSQCLVAVWSTWIDSTRFPAVCRC